MTIHFMGRQRTSRRPMPPAYRSRTASDLATVVPVEPNKPIDVSEPLPRLTRYSVDCEAPVGCSAATTRPFSPPTMSNPPCTANVVPALNAPTGLKDPLIE